MTGTHRAFIGLVILGIILLPLAGCKKPAQPTATAIPPTRQVETSPTDTPLPPPAVEATATSEATPYPAPPTSEPRPTVDYPEPDADGEQLLNERCGVGGACHASEGVDRVKSRLKTADQWRQTVLRMRGKGAKLTDAEMETLIQYLAEEYGK